MTEKLLVKAWGTGCLMSPTQLAFHTQGKHVRSKRFERGLCTLRVDSMYTLGRPQFRFPRTSIRALSFATSSSSWLSRSARTRAVQSALADASLTRYLGQGFRVWGQRGHAAALTRSVA